ncbi:MAG: hypothetical protein JRJ85_12785, partial [Deltaproteobacteria bacterium]|nr:hypothetical protein [Deltaproteobacteria bacterium]
MTTEHLSTQQASTRELSRDHTKEIIYAIRRLMQGGELYTKEINKKYNISAAQVNCLLALYENGPLPPSQIAKHM